jgi:hypothetical protein
MHDAASSSRGHARSSPRYLERLREMRLPISGAASRIRDRLRHLEHAIERAVSANRPPAPRNRARVAPLSTQCRRTSRGPSWALANTPCSSLRRSVARHPADLDVQVDAVEDRTKQSSEIGADLVLAASTRDLRIREPAAWAGLSVPRRRSVAIHRAGGPVSLKSRTSSSSSSMQADSMYPGNESARVHTARQLGSQLGVRLDVRSTKGRSIRSRMA